MHHWQTMCTLSACPAPLPDLAPSCLPCLQLSLDMDTPLEVVEMLRGAVEAHVRAHTSEFTGNSSGGVAGASGVGVLLVFCRVLPPFRPVS